MKKFKTQDSKFKIANSSTMSLRVAHSDTKQSNLCHSVLDAESSFVFLYCILFYKGKKDKDGMDSRFRGNDKKGNKSNDFLIKAVLRLQLQTWGVYD
jgi:hypothetical protein